MIRIDLKKDELSSSGKAGGAAGFIDNIKVPEKWRPHIDKFRSSTSLLDARILLTWVVALALAFIPYLFVAQWRHYLEVENARILRDLKEKDEAAQREITRYNSLKKEMESYEKQKELVKRRLDTVRRLLEERNTPVNVLDAIGQSLPRRTWLTGIKLDIGTKGTLSLVGKAYSNEDVADFSDKLSESIYLSNVTLVGVEGAREEQGVTLKSFTMTAVPKGTTAVNGEEDRMPASKAQTSPPSPGSEKKP